MTDDGRPVVTVLEQMRRVGTCLVCYLRCLVFRAWKPTIAPLVAIGALSVGGWVPVAVAWKPVTHVYLAEEALKDALDDGKLTIYRVNYSNGSVLKDGAGLPIKVGDYDANPVMLAAIRSYRAQFRAGVLGPDAYPDILTGQNLIHPAGANSPLQPIDIDINFGGPGTNPWLERLYDRAYASGNPQEKAFVAGFLAHAAGDIYMHTFVNYYTGGPFHFMPLPENAVKHIVLEGYVSKRAPSLSNAEYATSIAGVENFIYENMINGYSGSYLLSHLLAGVETSKSLPYIFSVKRNRLIAEIDSYYRTKAEYGRRIDAKLQAADDCAWWDVTCSATALVAQAGAIQAEKAYFVATNGLQTTYKEHWRDDITAGLRAWPAVSHTVAQAIMMNPSGVNTDAASDALKNYVLYHLISMAGAPDFVGLGIAAIGQIIDAVIAAIPIPGLRETIKQMKRDLFNYLLEKSYGTSVEELSEMLKNPEQRFDPTLDSPLYNLEGNGVRVSLQEFNTRELHIMDTGYTNPAERFDYRVFPPAWNTVTMIKLLLMDRDEVNRLMCDLGSEEQLLTPNAMLGFVRTLDGGNQWHANPIRMVAAKDKSFAYRKIFMYQRGETKDWK